VTPKLSPHLPSILVGLLPIIGAALLGTGVARAESQRSTAGPNVLFVAIDDLNDWIEPLGGHPQAKTPHLSRLAKQAVHFTQNYCAAPACKPSRTALLTGIHTYRSGIYSNYQIWREVLPEAVTLPRYFSQHGYWSAGAGKIFHDPDPRSWNAYFPSMTEATPEYFYPKPGGTVNMPAFENMYGEFDWAPIPIPDERTGDYQSVAWVARQLARRHDRPFFLACGIYRPHVPWYVPQKYFDLFPLESIQLPKTLDIDLDDLGGRSREIARRGGDYHRHVVAAGQWKKAVQGYLASIAFADARLGQLLDALERSPHSDNTIVVVWSDHGWQLGEKQHWRKFSLWDNVARCILMIKAPPGASPGLQEGSRNGARCERVTSLMDIYPTLVELCGLPAKEGLSGRSLVPLLRDPAAAWDHPAITTNHYGEFSIRQGLWHYIRYVDGSEELYNLQRDPEEWTNLAGDEEFRQVKARLAKHIPRDPAPLAETSFKLAPHHVPPYRSREDYLQRRPK